MVSGLLLCCLLTIAAANPVPMDNDTAPFQNVGVQDIVNGFDSKYGYFNWILSLKIYGQHVCGASLISPTRAITAAHCIFNSYPYTVQAGELHFDQSSGHEVSTAVKEIIVVGYFFDTQAPTVCLLANGHTYPVKDGILGVHLNYGIIVTVKHPQYNANDYWRNDIAILKFDAIPLGTYIQPVALVTDADGDLAGELCYIAGWGRTSGQAQGGSRMLKYSDILVMENSDCSNHWNGIRDTNICLEYFQYKVSACQGDSGGPLGCLINGGWRLSGVTSWGHRDCPGTKPSVYTRISKYLDWIAQNI